jgi:hypothetical protein
VPSRFRFVCVLAAAGVAAACRRAEPPFERFDVQLEIPPAKGQPALAPPEAVLRPWRVWVNQEEPRQHKAPAWRAVGAKEGANLELAADGRWRCLMNPVHVLGKANERAKIATWIVSRSIRCSRDEYRTSVEGRAQAWFELDGKEIQTTPSVPLYLNDTVGGQKRVTVVVLEGEQVKRRPMVD